MQLTHGVHRSARLNPEGAATLFAGRQRSWNELRERVARFAGALCRDGLRPGERVAVLALNSDWYLETYFAVLWAGGVVVPLNTRWSAPELNHAIRDAEASILVAGPSFLDLALALQDDSPSLRRILFAADAGSCSDIATIDEWCLSGPRVADAGRRNADLAGIFYTGGTTGFPKGVMLSHANFVANALALATGIELRFATRFLHAAPMFHVADASFAFSVTLFGGTHIVLSGFEPGAVCRAIAQDGATDTMLVPTMISMLLDHCEQTGASAATLGQLIYGASPMPETLLRRTMDAFPCTRLIQAFGQTELSPVATMLEPDFHVLTGAGAGRLQSAGRPIPTVEVRIASESGAELPVGEIGEIRVRGPNTMLGYWGNPELTAATLVDGWVRTGDVGRMDEEGFLYVVDRLKDMIVSGGENVYSAEVENALAQHPDVAACAIIGVPDDQWGERVHAIVVVKTGGAPTAEDLITHCRARIAGYKCPRSVEVRSTPLPVSAAGKVLKSELRKPYWEQHGRAVS